MEPLPADGRIVVVEDDSEGVAGGRADLTLEGRQQRQDHVHAERLLVPERNETSRQHSEKECYIVHF